MHISSTRWLAVLLTASAYGGVVEFDPPSMTIDTTGTSFGKFLVTISPLESLSSFAAYDMVIGSDDIDIFDWVTDPNVPCDGMDCRNWHGGKTGIYADDIRISGYDGPDDILFAPLLLGEIWIRIDGLAPGQYTILVDGERDGGISSVANVNDERELLFGSAVVTVIPEPTSLTLLLLGLATATTRRRKPVAS